MKLPATIEVPGVVYVIASTCEPLRSGVCVQGAIPGGTLYVDSIPRGTCVNIGPVDYEAIISACSGLVCDYIIHSTRLDVMLSL